MISTANNNKNKVISIIAAVVLGAAVFGLQGCGGGGDGTPAVVPDVTLSSASVSEGNSGTTNLDFTVFLSEATTVDVTVAYSTSDGTASADEDYTATSGSLTVPANATSATILVSVTGDLVTEDDETFNLQISSAANGTIANSSITVAGTIVNDDLAGYYIGSVDASVNTSSGPLVIAAADIKVIAANDRLVIINLTNNLVYIAPFTGFTQNSFVTTARIYKDGDFTTTTEISGTFITKASMDLTLAGTGEYTTGTVTLAYSATNSATPTIFVAGTSWFIPFDVGILINAPTNIDIATTSDVPSLALDQCDSPGVDLIDVVAEQTGRIRSFIAPTGVSCTDPSTDGTTLDGYLTTFQTTLTDDSMLFVWFNDFGAYAVSIPSP